MKRVTGVKDWREILLEDGRDSLLFEDRLQQLPCKLIEVLELVVRGHTSRDIADITGKTYKTIEVQRHQLFKRLGYTNIVRLAKAYWCWKTSQGYPRPVVIVRTFGDVRYYYRGYYHYPTVDARQQRPVETTDIGEAAVFEHAAMASRIVKEMNQLQGFPHWAVRPKPIRNEQD